MNNKYSENCNRERIRFNILIEKLHVSCKTLMVVQFKIASSRAGSGLGSWTVLEIYQITRNARLLNLWSTITRDECFVAEVAAS